MENLTMKTWKIVGVTAHDNARFLEALHEFQASHSIDRITCPFIHTELSYIGSSNIHATKHTVLL